MRKAAFALIGWHSWRSELWDMAHFIEDCLPSSMEDTEFIGGFPTLNMQVNKLFENESLGKFHLRIFSPI